MSDSLKVVEIYIYIYRVVNTRNVFITIVTRRVTLLYLGYAFKKALCTLSPHETRIIS